MFRPIHTEPWLDLSWLVHAKDRVVRWLHRLGEGLLRGTDGADPASWRLPPF